MKQLCYTLHCLSYPVRKLSKAISHKDRVLIISVILISLGCAILTHGIPMFPQWISETIGFLFHGLGFSPVADKYLATLTKI